MKLETALLFHELLCAPEEAAPCSCTAKENPMKPRLSMITLGVADLARATKFYRDGLGLPQEGDYEGVTFFKLRGAWLSLFPRDALARDAGASTRGAGFSGFTLAHNVASPEEVRAVLESAQCAGATILKAPQDAFWGGHHGFFADPDGFVWEVAWNPHLDLI